MSTSATGLRIPQHLAHLIAENLVESRSDQAKPGETYNTFSESAPEVCEQPGCLSLCVSTLLVDLFFAELSVLAC